MKDVLAPDDMERAVSRVVEMYGVSDDDLQHFIAERLLHYMEHPGWRLTLATDPMQALGGIIVEWFCIGFLVGRDNAWQRAGGQTLPTGGALALNDHYRCPAHFKRRGLA
jgi:hypothetical protein